MHHNPLNYSLALQLEELAAGLKKWAEENPEKAADAQKLHDAESSDTKAPFMEKVIAGMVEKGMEVAAAFNSPEGAVDLRRQMKEAGVSPK